MKKIFVRSPYFIEIDEPNQLGAKVELYVWRKGQTPPATPTYILSQNIASQYQTNVAFNISPYALDNIKPIQATVPIIPTQEQFNTWCYIRVVSYFKNSSGTYVSLDDETFVALNGFTLYEQGYNQYNANDVVLLYNHNITMYMRNYITNYVNCFFEVGDYDVDNGDTVETFTVTDATLYKIPINSNSVAISKDGVGEVFRINADVLCEPKYTPIICTYVNRYGGWQYLTFFKANRESLEVEFKDFNLMPTSVNYEPVKPITSTFNQQGKKKITVNTGWVYENYFDLIEDLMLSQTILLDGRPVYLNSKSTDKKTYIKDKNINYTIEFQYAYGVINDII